MLVALLSRILPAKLDHCHRTVVCVYSVRVARVALTFSRYLNVCCFVVVYLAREVILVAPHSRSSILLRVLLAD